jgi:Zn-dependent protease with chaperone function
MPIELPPGMAAYSDETPPTQKRQVLGVILFFAALIVTFFAIINFLAGQLVWWIPASVEQKLGAIIVPIYEQLAEPSAAQDTLNQLLDRLETQLPEKVKKDRDYQVLYIPEATVNALAIPGDRVIIYQGLLAKMHSENELMMVLGHELGHFAHRDHLRSLGRGLLLQIVFSTVLGDVGSLGSILVSGAETVSRSRFSQSQETQADELGLELLNKTYGQVVGATDFFEELSQEQGANFDFLTTHPAPAKRVKHIKKLIREHDYILGEPTALPPGLAALEDPSKVMN